MSRLASCLILCGVCGTASTPLHSGSVESTVQVGEPVTPHVFEGDVRDLPRPRFWRPGDPVRELEQFHDPHAGIPGVGPVSIDPLLPRQLQATTGVSDGFSVPTRSFDGIGFTGLVVPDSVGDVGPVHYVQGVNGYSEQQGSFVRIFDKASPVPNELATFQMRDLGGPAACQSVFGDPIVLYDRPADRWVLAEVAGLEVCVYVSQTADPLAGGWFSYVFTALNDLADYPKLAVWPTDANGGPGTYVATTNEAGPTVYALDRGAMLAGLPATPVRIEIAPLPAFHHQDALMPHPVGPDPPPPMAPVPVLRHRDTEIHGGEAEGDLLEIWLLDVDWIEPANTTLTPTAGVDVADFDSTPCSATSLSCFEQPAPAPPIHPLHEPIMYRLNYVNRGSFESLVGNFTVDADGTDHGGIRWFELRRTGGGDWTLYQEGTYSIDESHRWMGSIGVDRRGNLALGFNLTSPSIFPGLLYTGRRWFDPPGVMTVDEVVLSAGTGTVNTNRYGDYALMALDPTDDCTFWFTGEYSVADEWRTRIATFSFDSCDCAEPTAPTVQALATQDNRITLAWNDAPEPDVTDYVVRRSLDAGGPYDTVATIADTSPDTGGGPAYVFDDDDVSGGTTYYYVILARSGSCPSDPSVEAFATATGACTLPPVFAGLELATSSMFETCRVDLSWEAAVPECDGPVLYNVYRSTTPGFTPSPANLLAGGVAGTSAIDVSGLQSGSTVVYVVRAVDAGGGAEDGNLVERSVVVGGPNSGTHFLLDEDFEDPAAFDDWTVWIAAGSDGCLEWERTDSTQERPLSGSGFYARAIPEGCGLISGTTLESSPVDLSFAGLDTVLLEVDVSYHQQGGGYATIDVLDDGQWLPVWTDPNADFDDRILLDVTSPAAGQSAFQVRFGYQNAWNDKWFSVDNVHIITMADVACATSPAPPPVPDGSAGTDPLRVARQDPAGTALDVFFDATSCPAPTYHVIFGDLAGVAGPAITGSECNVTAGAFAWGDLPAGDLFFLMIGSDGDEIESRWGQGAFGERAGLAASGQCGSAAKDVSASCP